MSRRPISSRSWLPAAVAAFGLVATPMLAAATPCVVPNNNGTVSLPPQGCGYVSPTDVHMIINGLPPGTTINIGIEHSKFFNVTTTPGGTLGGEVEHFTSQLLLTMNGTGALAGFHKVVPISATCESDVAPRTPAQVVQSFDTEMHAIQGQLPPGDPDFDLLRITAGTGFGMPSPGHTTLTLQSDGNWNVDSFFDITYRIDFVGHAGGPLGGMSGSTTGTIRMASGQPAPAPPAPCTLPANPTGTVDLPPNGCGYVSPADLHMMINGLPPGTTITVGVQHQDFFGVTHTPDPTGETEQFGSQLQLRLDGTGGLAGFHRTKSMQAQCQSHVDAHDPGFHVQSFDTDMFRIQGQLPPGDPDFDLLRITAGTGFGMPSPGHTTLTPNPPGSPNFTIDSFFDITYRIDFVGHSPGPLGGMSGSTTGTIRMEAGQPSVVAVPNGHGPAPRDFSLTNSPNPGNAGTVLQYRLPASANVELTVFDANGRVIRHLMDEKSVPAGPHAMLWDARDDAGRVMGPGVYLVKLTVDGLMVASRKASIVR